MNKILYLINFYIILICINSCSNHLKDNGESEKEQIEKEVLTTDLEPLVSIEKSVEPNIPESPINIGMEWDLSNAKNAAIQKLYRYGGTREFGQTFFADTYHNDLMDHEFLFYDQLGRDDKARYVLFYYSKPTVSSYICRACGVHLSLFEFTLEQEAWVLTHTQINFDQAGEWGNPPQIYKAFAGPDNYGFEVTGRATSSIGWYGNYHSLFLKVEGHYQEVFRTWLYQSWPNNDEYRGIHDGYQTKPQFLSDTTNGAFDILLSATEFKQRIEAGEGITQKCQFLYQFDGEAYHLMVGELPKDDWLNISRPCSD